jgi:hypothetical protein
MMWAPATSGASTNRNVAALPILPNDANINPQLLARLQAAVERIATLDGQRGDALDAALTKRDLVNVGLLKVGQNGSIDGLNDSTFSGGWSNIPYLDAMPTPAPPTFKTGIGANFLFWQLPNARGVGATQVFRRTDTAGGAIIAAPTGSMYADLPVDYGTTYYYKIRFVSERGVAGDWSSEVAVVSEADPAYLIEALQGKVDDSLLARDLRNQVAIGGELKDSITSVAGTGGRNAGFSFGSDGKVSGFYVMADMFAVLSSANGAPVTPFIVSGNNTYINNATIKDASITGAKIAEATITSANIASLNVMDIAVGNRINSSNYNQTTKTGWAINQDGSAEFYGSAATFGGKLAVRRVGSGAGVDITNDGIKVYDNNGVLRVAIGSLV